ncbi:hypothetical protein O7621_02200 [Solwaraspora sp. WMMD937]|uniref:hypothetical protein n=1 Tax=Solwaraspora sp. WMMD937 TaxID=3016090 RepID=UPI00249B5F92|nr:hypothetical protein [Solwaraspora sp. WMMD937]WFE22205.1 hypothetical protein O7621_02200 [Solwaraspora sp. WMMD937]
MRRHLPTQRAALLIAVLVLGGCGDASAEGVPLGAASSATGPESGGLTAERAGVVLSAFDQADSAASSTGDIEGLRLQETSPALDFSVAAVRRAAHHQRQQPAFRHVNPGFALPTGAASCFLVVATLQLSGAELAPTVVSQFVESDGTWKLSHNVRVSQEAVIGARGVGGTVAGPAEQLLDVASRQALAGEVFARTIGSSTGNRALVDPGALLDEQFAAGWSLYQQQLAGTGVQVDREFTGAQWGPCAASTSAGTVTFLTLYATDVLVPAPDGAATVTLPPESFDLIALGRTEPASGSRIEVSRVETFLLLIPESGSGATVLGLNDTAIAIDIS